MDEVRTERLLLRRPVAQDAPFALALLADPGTTAHNPSDALTALADAEALLLRWDAQWTAGLGYWIVEDGAGTPIGVCGVKAVELAGQPIWNLLYRFLPSAWGHGYAREAAAAAVRAAELVDPLGSSSHGSDLRTPRAPVSPPRSASSAAPTWTSPATTASMRSGPDELPPPGDVDGRESHRKWRLST